MQWLKRLTRLVLWILCGGLVGLVLASLLLWLMLSDGLPGTAEAEKVPPLLVPVTLFYFLGNEAVAWLRPLLLWVAGLSSVSLVFLRWGIRRLR